MTDFYTVLRQSLIDRNLRSAARRQDAYAQARTAMVRRLWSFDPPLAEDEIDARIGEFDIAVDRIERDVVAAFAEADRAPVGRRPPPPPEPAPRPLPRPPTPTVVDGYDEMADYLPAFAGQSLPAPADDAGAIEDEEDPFVEAVRRTGPVRRAITIEERRRLVEAALAESAEEAETERTDGRSLRRPAPVARSHRGESPQAMPARQEWAPPPAAVYGDEPEPERQDFDLAEEPADPREEDAAGTIVSRDDGRAYGVRQADNRRHGADAADFDQAREADAYAEPYAPRDDDRPPLRRPRGRPQTDRARVRLLGVAVAALAVVLIGTSVYVFRPVLLGTAPSADDTVPPPAAAAAPPAPATPADASETITLFDGRDPTVFEADSNNPIRFTGSPGSGFATISTSSSSAGARVVIGPGLSSRLAGETVRVSLVARSAKENGATSMRFAYQSGLAISHWQAAKLAGDFATFELVWRVPTMRTNPAGDLILIEPGIPGDGTAADIRSVTIDVLKP